MSFLRRVHAEGAGTEANRMTTIVRNMMADKRFTDAIEDMVDASKTAITYAHISHNEHMLQFNTLCLNFFQAIQQKKENEAIDAAHDLVKAGHGKAFGLA